MAQEEHKDPILSIYRSYIEGEVRRPEIQEHKRIFIKNHFHHQLQYLQVSLDFSLDELR